jgi:DNA-binding transcriptional regulator YhcF (GntR family)
VSLWERWRLEFNDRLPIYRQIILFFCQAFARGDIKPGERIPSIREMSEVLKVNTNTIQRVYQEMERDNLISSRRGTGYFFTEDEKMIKKTSRNLSLDSLGRFIDEMRALGYADKEILSELELFIKGDKQHG